MKVAIAAVLMSVASVGCATTPSTYTDTSTPDQKNIQATGMAAVEAARSNRNVTQVNFVPGQWDGTSVDHLGNPIIYDANGRIDHRASIRYQQRRDQYKQPSISQWAGREFKREADYKMKRKIRAKIDKITDKLF